MVDSQCTFRAILRSAHLPEPGAFGNTDVILERPGDQGRDVPRYFHDDDVGCHQAEHTPVHLVIGSRATDAQLQRAAERFGLDIEVLRRFRDEGVARG